MRSLENTHISLETTKPEDLNSGVINSTIFSFGTRAGRKSLFLTLPSNEGVSKKDAITSSRMMMIRITPTPNQHQNRPREPIESVRKNHFFEIKSFDVHDYMKYG